LIFVGVLSKEKITIWNLAVTKYLKFIQWLNCAHNTESCTCNVTIDTFVEEVKDFIRLLREIHPKPDNVVTPYLHSLMHHVPAMIRKYGSLRPFSTSAQELKNSIQTLIQFRASNQHNVPLDLETHQVTSLWFAAHPEICVPLKRCNLRGFEKVPIECK
jgi:hypothetical protein